MTDVRLLGDRYEMGPVLGYGGMAEVYRGTDLRLGRDVAIKVLRSELARDPGFQARFRREAQNAAALSHPSIVSVYDTGEDGEPGHELPFIVMEYVEGRTLKEVLTAEGPLPPRDALEMVADVCAALDFSHRHGIVHRDIKPGNVMLTPTGAVKVMDFGIARAMTSATAAMTQTSAVIGTAQYLSPEQARGETVDARSDVYSTGCLLYELLVGRPPFTGDNPVSVAYQHVREDPVPPSDLDPNIPAPVDAIVLKAMAKNPANRYQTAAEMRADLLRAAAGRPVAATPVLPLEERTAVLAGARGRHTAGGGYPTRTVVTEQPRRSGGTYALVALAVLTLLALIGFGALYLAGNSRPEVAVPSVIGKDEAVARELLRERKFTVDARKIESSAAQKGKVVDQNPGADERVDEGSTVVIWVGQGPELVEVPKVIGMSREGAQNLLETNDLKAATAECRSSSTPKGTVLTSAPKPGEKAPEGSTVTLTLSCGDLIKVPDVVGKTEQDATALLRSEGFQVRVVDQISTSTPGTVLDQTPDQGTDARRNTTVTITVARSIEESESPSPSPTPTPTETPETPAPGNGNPGPLPPDPDGRLEADHRTGVH